MAAEQLPPIQNPGRVSVDAPTSTLQPVVNAQMSDRIAQRTAESGRLETLTREELRLRQ